VDLSDFDSVGGEWLRGEGPEADVVMSSRVSYADLDLAKPADVAALEKRIKEAANFVCDKLGKAYPDSGPDTKECAKRAADKALAEARKVAATRK
jgi:UrcA family protein